MYDDDDFDSIEDRWEPSRPKGGLPPDRRPPSDGRRTLIALAVALAVMLVVGVGAFIAGGAVGSHTDTVERTVTDVVTATAPPDDTDTDAGIDTGPGSGAVNCSQGPSARKGYEPNDTAEQAAGPLTADEPLKGELRATQDVDYWIFCVTQPTQVTLNLVCARGACDDLTATFPADADFADTFATDKPLTCKLPRAGRYRVAVDSDTVPVIYRIGIQAQDTSVIADKVPPNFPDGPDDLSC